MQFSMMPTRSISSRSGMIPMKYQQISNIGKIQKPLSQKIEVQKAVESPDNNLSKKTKLDKSTTLLEKINKVYKGPKVFSMKKNLDDNVVQIS